MLIGHKIIDQYQFIRLSKDVEIDEIKETIQLLQLLKKTIERIILSYLFIFSIILMFLGDEFELNVDDSVIIIKISIQLLKLLKKQNNLLSEILEEQNYNYVMELSSIEKIKEVIKILSDIERRARNSDNSQIRVNAYSIGSCTTSRSKSYMDIRGSKFIPKFKSTITRQELSSIMIIIYVLENVVNEAGKA